MRRKGIVALFILLFFSLSLGIPAAIAGETQDIVNKAGNTLSEPAFNLYNYEKDSQPFYYRKLQRDNISIFRHKSSEFIIQNFKYNTSDTSFLTGSERYAGSLSNPFNDLPVLGVLPYEGESADVLSGVDLNSDRMKDDDNASSILLSPKVIKEACDEDPSSHVNSMIKAGLSNIKHVVVAAMKEFSKFRYDASKEKSRSMDRSGLVKLLGWFCQASVMDANEDGNVDTYALNFVRIY